VIDYFTKLKIDMAKQLVRDNHMNFTQIADYLGYSSIHYFSRQFKKTTGMTPSEYSSSIKVLSEKNKR
jgi:YesN/AraC family two-component response regulator